MDVSTKALLNAKAHANCISRYCYRDEPADDPMCGKVLVATLIDKGAVPVNLYATKEEICGVLQTREHVPTKKEATLIRALKAKTKQSEEWLRKHSKYGQMIADAAQPNRKEIGVKQFQRLAELTNKDYMRGFKIKSSRH